MTGINTKVINLFGGPSAGKSTMAAQIFGDFKAQRKNVEYVPEFAKDLVWQASSSLDDQLYVLGNQHHRLYTLLGQVEWIVTDSPIILQLYYINLGFQKYREDMPGDAWHDMRLNFRRMVRSLHFQYENYNFEVLRGDRAFVQAGRNQTEEEAKQIDEDLVRLMHQEIDFRSIRTKEEIYDILNAKGVLE